VKGFGGGRIRNGKGRGAGGQGGETWQGGIQERKIWKEAVPGGKKVGGAGVNLFRERPPMASLPGVF